MLIAIGCFLAFANLTNNTDKQAARDYLDQIKPKLEQYRQGIGHYPDALAQLPALPPPPPGFIYRREKPIGPLDPDTYRIDYFSLEYWSGSNTWFDDD